MPLVYQQNINADTKIAVWHINEREAYFLEQVPLKRAISHPHKRLQHLAGRLLLVEMFPDFPIRLIQIADTRKPFLENEPFHFSISHCGEYAAAIVSKSMRVGVDVEMLHNKIEKIQHKFMDATELPALYRQCPMPPVQALTLYWSVKESAFKWWGSGQVDFKADIILKTITGLPDQGIVKCLFKEKYHLEIHYLFFSNTFLTWVFSFH